MTLTPEQTAHTDQIEAASSDFIDQQVNTWKQANGQFTVPMIAHLYAHEDVLDAPLDICYALATAIKKLAEK
jgi:hypothetical protein